MTARAPRRQALAAKPRRRDTTAAPPVEAAKDPREVGATGTENYSGYITGEDYNAALQPPTAFRIYEEMRKSDAQVRGSLWVLKQPLLSASWSVQAPKDATPEEQAIAAFCHGALFDRGAMVDGWDFVLRHALLQLDFGVSVLEKVWTLNAQRQIVPHRLAPRLPRTIERWVLDEQDRLSMVQQLAVKQGQLRTLDLPADSLAVFVHDREGDNWWGTSVLRSAYKHWYLKAEVERTEAVRLYRFGVGVPMASKKLEGMGAASNPTEDEKVDEILKGLASHEKSYIRTTDAWTWSILVPESSGQQTGAIDSIRYHNQMIVRNVLADFMSDTADGLNSGRTRTLADIFAAALYALAEQICQVFDLSVIRPMCDYNFTMAAHRYPTMKANDVTDVDVKMMADVLVRLGVARFVTPDDDIEALLREVMGLPPLPEAMRGQSRARGPASGTAGLTDGTPLPAPVPVAAAARPLALARKSRAVEWSGRLYAREPSAFELSVFSLAEVPDTLDVETGFLVAQLATLRHQQLETLAQQIAAKDARPSTGAFTDLRPDLFTVPLKAEVERAIKATTQRVAEFGVRQVRLELVRQGAAIDLGAAFPARAVALGTAGDNRRTAKSALTSSAKVATEQETDGWFNRILETAVRIRRGGVQGDALANAIQQRLFPELETGLKGLAKGKVHEAFGIGRAVEAEAHRDEIAEAEYSALLDANTCEPCADLDGEFVALGSDRYREIQPPYQGCDGNKGRPDACRCVFLFHLK